MDTLANDYMLLFSPEDETTAQTYVEGIENCVTKNLFNALFGAFGTGQKNPTVSITGAQSSESNLHNEVSEAHLLESEQNE